MEAQPNHKHQKKSENDQLECKYDTVFFEELFKETLFGFAVGFFTLNQGLIVL